MLGGSNITVQMDRTDVIKKFYETFNIFNKFSVGGKHRGCNRGIIMD